jgi:imidazolonepropionase-like amidohydrolase
VRGELEAAADVLISATSGNAEMMGQAGRLGVVAPGALADLIAVAGNPLEDLGVLQDAAAIPLVMKAGTAIHQDF